MNSSYIFRIYIPFLHKVDTYRKVKFEPLSFYTSIVNHYPPLPSDIADELTTTNQPLSPDFPTMPKISIASTISSPSPPENIEEY